MFVYIADNTEESESVALSLWCATSDYSNNSVASWS